MRKESLAEELGNVKQMVSCSIFSMSVNPFRNKRYFVRMWQVDANDEIRRLCNNKDWFNINLKIQKQWRDYWTSKKK